MSGYEQIHDPGRPDMIRAEHPDLVLITLGDRGVIRISITDHEGLTHVFMHGAGPLYYVETRKEDRDGEQRVREEETVSAYLTRDNALAESTIHRCSHCDQRITAPGYMRRAHQCERGGRREDQEHQAGVLAVEGHLEPTT